jgi:hypothetical protein
VRGLPSRMWLHSVRARELGDRGHVASPRSFQRQVGADPSFVSRLKLSNVLKAHTGCVNTVGWSENGELLISGRFVSRSKYIISYTSFRESAFIISFLPSKCIFVLFHCSIRKIPSAQLQLFSCRSCAPVSSYATSI